MTVLFRSTVIRMKTQIFVDLFSLLFSFFQRSKKAPVYVFTADLGLHKPLLCSFVPSNSCRSTSIVFSFREIHIVFRTRNIIKIFDSVINSVAVYVAYFFFGHLPIVDKPHDSVNQHFPAVYGCLNVFNSCSEHVPHFGSYFNPVTSAFFPKQISGNAVVFKQLYRSFIAYFNISHLVGVSI